jgi:hypothetical protein
MAQTVKIDYKKTIYAVYQKTGMIEACDWVIEHNRVSGAKSQIPFERCKACDTNTPSIKHECCICGQKTKKPTAPKFYKAVLKPIKDVMKHVYPMSNMTLAERMGNDNATCPDCGNNEWMLLADESVAIKQGGKPYCECLGCGYMTHL